MDNLIVGGFCGALVAGLCALSYLLGKKEKENDVFKNKEKTADKVRRLRDSLLDDALRDKLHNRFKR